MSNPLTYTPNPSGLDVGRYDVTTPREFRGDHVLDHADLTDLPALAESPDWEDRVRAEVLRREATITLPDGFPCIYETEDSPNKRGVIYRFLQSVWVVSPDEDMLHALLPDYQALWDSYTDRWGPSSRRVFTVGRLDGLKPFGVYRPGTTPEQVIGATMLTHSDMYGRAPERLRRMHPQHERWTAARAARGY